jgi:peptide/nickel transport system ATP-binding protein
MSDNWTGQAPILEIINLQVGYRQGNALLEAVSDVSLHIHAGETYGLVGESGSGKTTLVLAVMRHLSESGLVCSGRVLLSGQDLLELSPADIRQVWGRQITMVPQNPQSALNPSMRVGEQLVEILRYQKGFDSVHSRQAALEWFERVHLADPHRVADSFPHQISGGMQQRALIAMAMCTEPQLLILDEPTTSLDVTTQAVILDLVRELIEGCQTAALYVTHNLGVVAQVCQRVGVMYAGELVEEAETQALFREPLHPYTVGLIESIPQLGKTKDKVNLRPILGQIPAIGEWPPGCVFRPRCPLAIEICEVRPDLYPSGKDRQARCHRWEEIACGEAEASQPIPDGIGRAGEPDIGESVLNVSNLEVRFRLNRSAAQWLQREPAGVVRAVDGVNLAVKRSQTLGLVGESGSGKTTLARALLGLTEPSAGIIELNGQPLPPGLEQRDRDILRSLQMVFQNPDEAFNPHLTIGESLSRPLITLLKKSPLEAGQTAGQLLEAVRLPASYVGRYPEQLSGGELQRAALARAYASHPDLLICDEPVSSLDVSVQAAILNLIEELQARQGTSLLFISHNLAVVGYLADEVAVIYLGTLMEVSKSSQLFQPPYHPYTEALLSSIPTIDGTGAPVRLEGDIPSPAEIPGGCPFHTRCPRFLGSICVEQTPPWRSAAGGKKHYFCHIPQEDLLAVQKRLVQPGQIVAG